MALLPANFGMNQQDASDDFANSGRMQDQHQQPPVRQTTSSSSSVRKRNLQQMLTNASQQNQNQQDQASDDNNNNSDNYQHQPNADFDDTDPLEQAAKRNTRSAHLNFSKGGMSIRRRLQHQVDDRLEFDATTFQGLEFDEIRKLREEIHHRCRLSNGTAWKNDMRRAKGESLTSSPLSKTSSRKRLNCEGSELFLNPKPVTPHISTPRIEVDASIAKRMGDMTVTPGPTDYFPRPVPTRTNSRWIAFLPSSPPKRLDDEMKKETPHPLSYHPHKPLGDDRPKWTIQKRPVFATGGTIEDDINKFTGPTSYPPPISDFDVNRKMPNGATSARFFIAREVRHHAPGPLDTAPSSVTKWVWKDPANYSRATRSSSSSSTGRRPKWQPVGSSNYMAEMDPLPASEVAARKRRQEAYERKLEKQRENDENNSGEQQQDGAGNTNRNSQRNQNGDSVNSSSARGKKSSSSSSFHKHLPALLLLNALHKTGYQHLRLVTASPSKQQNQQDEQKGKKRKNSGEEVPIFHIASKFSVENGSLTLKKNAEYLLLAENKGEIIPNVSSCNLLVNFSLPTPPWEQEDPKRNNPSDEEKKQYDEDCQKSVNDQISQAVVSFQEKYKPLADRSKGRDFTYCSWYQKMLNSISPGDTPLRIEQDHMSGKMFVLTLEGKTLDAPPLK